MLCGSPSEEGRETPSYSGCETMLRSLRMAADAANPIRREMMADAVITNQKTIIANQKAILSNQKTILSNQGAIKKNQKGLDAILANQKEILKNQKAILEAVKK
jgi:hypothetical protein